MTETENVKALEYCADENNCAECPLKGTRFELDHSCAEELMKLSAEIIKNLMAENERLKSDNDILSKNLHNLSKELEAEKIRNF